jgi:hypothetical protein
MQTEDRDRGHAKVRQGVLNKELSGTQSANVQSRAHAHASSAILHRSGEGLRNAVVRETSDGQAELRAADEICAGLNQRGAI